MLPERIPEHRRRAVRLALGVGIPCFIGFGVIGPEHLAYSAAAQTICKWAAITAAIVAQPLIGKATQVGAERILGTVLGGFCGFLVHTIGSELLFGEYSDGTWLAISAAILASLSILVGHRYKLDTSARLFTITFLLVTFAGDAGEASYKVAFIRVSGILLGVLLMLVLSVVILPKSATVEALHCVDKALLSLHTLHSLAWRDYSLPEPSKLKKGSNFMHPSISLEDSPRETAAQSLPLLANEEGDRSAAVRLEEMRDAAQSGVYSALFALQDNVACAKSEVLLGSFWGHVVLVPGLPFGLGKKEVRHLPWNNLARTSLSIRRAARVMVSLGEAIEAGDRARVLQAMPSGEALLREVARAGHAVLEQIRRAFPTERGVTHEAALRLLGAVKAWEAAAGEAAHSQLQAWHRYQVTLASWEVMERTVSSTTLREHLSGPSSLPAREVALGTGPGAGAGAVVSPPEAAKDQQPPCPPMPPTPPLQKAEEDERKSPFANAGKVATRAPKGGEGGQAMVGALPEWQMLTFLLRQLSLAVVDVYECLLSVMEDIPRIEG